MLEQGSRYSAAAVPKEDQAAEWYQLGCDLLQEADVQQYEISNFARPGHHSLHNLKYWHRQPYIGFGLDAHSMLLANQNAVRFANTSDLDRYLGQGSGKNPFPLLESLQPKSDGQVDVIGRNEAFE